MKTIIVDSNVFINAFKQDSEFRAESIGFLTKMIEIGQLITMPAHGWFEIQCSIKRISKYDKKFIAPTILGKKEFPINLIHIDENFIAKYSKVEVPYVKSGDHLFLVVAKHNGFPLITRDKGLTKSAQEADVNVFTPNEFLRILKLL